MGDGARPRLSDAAAQNLRCHPTCLELRGELRLGGRPCKGGAVAIVRTAVLKRPLFIILGWADRALVLALFGPIVRFHPIVLTVRGLTGQPRPRFGDSRPPAWRSAPPHEREVHSRAGWPVW